MNYGHFSKGLQSLQIVPSLKTSVEILVDLCLEKLEIEC